MCISIINREPSGKLFVSSGLKKVHFCLMRILFNAHSKTATELFFLETGKIPLRFTISKRRLLYLWTILTRGEEELTSKVYQAQKVKKTRGDWYVMIQEEKKKYEITLSDEDISDLSTNKFKSYVEKKVNTFALKHLKAEAAKHSKSLGILTEKMEETKLSE